jgi:hypothetical protein
VVFVLSLSLSIVVVVPHLLVRPWLSVLLVVWCFFSLSLSIGEVVPHPLVELAPCDVWPALPLILSVPHLLVRSLG